MTKYTTKSSKTATNASRWFNFEAKTISNITTKSTGLTFLNLSSNALRRFISFRNSNNSFTNTSVKWFLIGVRLRQKLATFGSVARHNVYKVVKVQIRWAHICLPSIYKRNLAV